MIILFEGPDASGKDVLRRAFEAKTDYQHTCVTRFMFSQFVYAQYYRRPLFTDGRQNREYVAQMKKFCIEFRPLVVYTKADVGVLGARVQQRGEKLSDQPDAASMMTLYERLFKMISLDTSPRFLAVDTSFNPDLGEVSDRIVGKVAKLEGRIK